VRQDRLLTQLRDILASAPALELVALEPHLKDGGVFAHVRFAGDDVAAAHTALLQHVAARGGIPRWTGLGRGDVWLVKGRPWREVAYNLQRASDCC
jgi:hypothetical protein